MSATQPNLKKEPSGFGFDDFGEIGSTPQTYEAKLEF